MNGQLGRTRRLFQTWAHGLRALRRQRPAVGMSGMSKANARLVVDPYALAVLPADWLSNAELAAWCVDNAQYSEPRRT